MKKFILLTLLMITAIGCNDKSGEVKAAKPTTKTVDGIKTGQIINGLRVFTQADIESGKLSAFRGDYVKIEVAGEAIEFKIDSLNIAHSFPTDTTGKKYFKLKKVGSFNYSFGKTNGTITIDEYQQANYRAVDPKEGAEIIKNISPLILDVRTKGEYMSARLKDAKLIPVQVIQTEYTQIEDYKDKPIFIYCASGNRSTVAARILIEKGFTNIYNLRPGIGGWYRAGLEIVK